MKADMFPEDRGALRSKSFNKLQQTLIEMLPEGSDERSGLESISTHFQARRLKVIETGPLPFVNFVGAEQERPGSIGKVGHHGDYRSAYRPSVF